MVLNLFPGSTLNISAEPLHQVLGNQQSFHFTLYGIPYSANSPIPIQHHCKEQVKQLLDKDIEVGFYVKPQYVNLQIDD